MGVDPVRAWFERQSEVRTNECIIDGYPAFLTSINGEDCLLCIDGTALECPGGGVGSGHGRLGSQCPVNRVVDFGRPAVRADTVKTGFDNTDRSCPMWEQAAQPTCLPGFSFVAGLAPPPGQFDSWSTRWLSEIGASCSARRPEFCSTHIFGFQIGQQSLNTISMARNPNQRDIAKAAGVCVATVSLAMRNHPSISEATRQRVRKVADDLGYCPNPRVAELMGQIRRNRAVDALKESVAMFWPDMDAPAVDALFFLRQFESGARNVLEQNGVGMEVIYQEAGLETKRVERMLRTRGIRGLILAPLMHQPRMELDWNWSNLSVVIAGSAEWQPDFNRVRFNHFAEMGILVGQINQRGSTRLGLVIDESLEQRSLHAIDGGFWAAVPDVVRKSDAVFKKVNQGREAFVDWMASYQPDSLIIGSPEVLEWIASMESPPPVYMRSLEKRSDEEPFSGIRQDYERLGQTAAEQLLAQLQTNKSGVPGNAFQTLITGRWEEGDG